MRIAIDRLGATGIFLTVLLSPCCFPLLGGALAALGLGTFATFELFGEWTLYVLQGLALVSFIGIAASYFRHRIVYPLLIAVPSLLLTFYGFYFSESDSWLQIAYAGMLGLVAATGVNLLGKSKMKTLATEVTLISEITCPKCGHRKQETMPTDACQYFYKCEGCGSVLKPLAGDCCVFCSYGTAQCPPVQQSMNCCR